MIILPPAPMEARPSLIDYGILQRAALGGATNRLNRKGNRYRVAVSAGPFHAEDEGRTWVADLIAAKQEGGRIRYPLQWSQGNPGAPVVNGAGQQGTTLLLRGLTPGYVAKKGYWLSITNAAGRSYLHNVKATAAANNAGLISLTLNEQLRHQFADGAVVQLAAPVVEGWIDGSEWEWEHSVNRVIPISFTIEEAE